MSTATIAQLEEQTKHLPVSPLLRETLADIDRLIAQTPDANEKMELRQTRISTILSELPEHIIDQYETACAEIDSLVALQAGARTAKDWRVYPYRELAQIARRWPAQDVTHAPLRKAIRTRYGMDLDEIAAHVGLSEDEVMTEAANIARAIHDTRDSAQHLARVRAFARSIETGAILGITPQHRDTIAAVASNEPTTITTLAAAKRAGKACKAGKSHKAARSARTPATANKRERKPLMTAQEATSFQTFSVANALTVKHSLPCGCEPYVDVFTYNRWRAQGMQVQRGQKAIKIPVIAHGTKEDPDTGETQSYSVKTVSAVFCRCQVKSA